MRNSYPEYFFLKKNTRTFLSVQWLKLWAYTAGGSGPIPGGEEGTGIPHDTERGQEKKKKKLLELNHTQKQTTQLKN